MAQIMPVEDASRSLEYILKPIDERISWRNEKGLTLQEWYKRFQAEPISSYGYRKRHMSRRDVAKALNLSASHVEKLAQGGYLGEGFEYNVKGWTEKRVSTSLIRDIRDKLSKSIPVSFFLEMIEREVWY